MKHGARHSIEVRTAEPLPQGQAGAWARAVRDHGPSGIVAEADVLIGRQLKSSRLFCIKGPQGYHYVVPLSRDLEEAEADSIAQGWNQSCPDGDWVINWSQRSIAESQISAAHADLMEQIAELAAQRYHQQWHDGKLNDGWSFAHRMDAKGKRHPMLQPWHSLPESYRVTERDRFRTLLGVLEGLDLQITRR